MPTTYSGTFVGADADTSSSLGIWTGDVAHPGISSSGSTLTITGGSATGGSGSTIDAGAASGVVSSGDAVTISGGTFKSGADQLNSPPAVVLTLPTACSISGGSFIGGNSTGISGGAGLTLSLDSSVAATITGGTFGGGTPLGLSVGMALSGGSTLFISGGSFSGSIAISIQDTASVTFSGSGLAYSGGVITGTLGGVTVSLTIVCLNSSPFTVSGTTSALVLSA